MAVITIGTVIAETQTQPKEYRLIHMLYTKVVSEVRFTQDVEKGLVSFPGFEMRPESITLTGCDVTKGGVAYLVAGYQNGKGKYVTKAFYTQDRKLLRLRELNLFLIGRAVEAAPQDFALLITKYQLVTLSLS